MPRKLKVVLSIVFVLAVAFVAARSCSVPKPKPAPPKAVKKIDLPIPETAKMAIILDDWGNHLSLAKTAIDIQRPLTLSILPNLPHSRKIAEQAKKAGLGVMLHMPMQPISKAQPLEPHTIMTDTPDAEIRAYLDNALASIPGVEGVNNHQGSAATSDTRVMHTVLTHLKKKHLFFVDSAVIAQTVGAKTAEELGIPFAKRDVFLDNTPTIEAVKAELRQAAKIALKYKKVVCIGHDKTATLEGIRQMVPELEAQGIRLVLAEELLQ